MAMSTERIQLNSPLKWLKQGWADFVRHPVPGLAHGLALALFGWLLIAVAHDRFWLLAGAFSGFMVVAPILTSGLYVISRNSAVGSPADLSAVFKLWRSFDRRLVIFGLLLNLAGTGWVLTSAAMITALAPVPIQSPVDFLRHVVLQPDVGLFEAWLLVGGLLAAPVFASSVVAIPMLVDTDSSVRDAVMTSWRAVGAYPVPLALWATLIMVLVGAGMLTGLLGLIIAVPWLAHASWHAYVDLTAAP
ncbi:MAG TPA: DUF2189 domain-containing protein [Burkholderiaceae bacterium]|nr:DUF2189 domain-containing protein [Burkholderiaceae bacterium]